MKRAPRVVLNLLHSKTDTSRFWINGKHLDLNGISGSYDLAGMLDALGPTHLRHVHQPLDTALQFNKRAIVGNTCYLAGDAAVKRKALFDRSPRVRQQLLVAERHSLAFAVELEHLNLNSVAYLEKLAWVLKTTP